MLCKCVDQALIVFGFTQLFHTACDALPIIEGACRDALEIGFDGIPRLIMICVVGLRLAAAVDAGVDCLCRGGAADR